MDFDLFDDDWCEPASSQKVSSQPLSSQQTSSQSSSSSFSMPSSGEVYVPEPPGFSSPPSQPIPAVRNPFLFASVVTVRTVFCSIADPKLFDPANREFRIRIRHFF